MYPQQLQDLLRILKNKIDSLLHADLRYELFRVYSNLEEWRSLAKTQREALTSRIPVRNDLVGRTAAKEETTRWGILPLMGILIVMLCVCSVVTYHFCVPADRMPDPPPERDCKAEADEKVFLRESQMKSKMKSDMEAVGVLLLIVQLLLVILVLGCCEPRKFCWFVGAGMIVLLPMIALFILYDSLR